MFGRKCSLAGVMVAMSMAGLAWADDSGPVELEVSPKMVSMSPGGTAAIRINIRIESPFHIYAPELQVGAAGGGPVPTQLAVKTKDLISLDGPLKISRTSRHFDTNFGMDVVLLEGDAWIETAIKANANVKPGKHPVVLVVTYQACSDTRCLMPRDAEVAFDLEIGVPAQAAAVSKTGSRENALVLGFGLQPQMFPSIATSHDQAAGLPLGGGVAHLPE